jgi:hypothetical protein
VRWRSLFVWRSARMSSMLAPVVPMKLARTAPARRKEVLTRGVARRSPRRTIPPEMMNSVERRIRNDA